MDLRACLSDPHRYERQVDRLHRRYLFMPQLYELRQDGVPLATLVHNRSRVARLLARAVRRGEYELAPGQIRTIEVRGKRRQVFSFRLTDLLVHGVVAEVVREATEPLLSPQLYSYRKHVSWWLPVSDFAAYVRAHRRERPDPRLRGLYVLRRDVEAYTDSIPVGGRSPLWPMLRRTLEPASDYDWSLVEGVVRPVMAIEGGTATPVRGVPTGQPISCVLFNAYLHELDRALDVVPGAFYARYSDDILFAHPDADVVRSAADTIAEVVERHGLELAEGKSRDLYLTAAGRPSATWPQARGTSTVPFLGTLVGADGTVGLSRTKLRRLLRELGERAERAARSAGSTDRDRVGRAVCAALNRALDARPGPFQQRSSALLRAAVTDRRQLAQLDHLIARTALRAVTGDGSVRAFRTTPYRVVRERWGLVSLEHARNRWGRARCAS